MAIEFVAPPLRLEEFDTAIVAVRVLNRAGDTIPGAPVRLASLTPDTVAIDTTGLGLIGVQPGPGRVVALAGSLASAPLTVTVVRAPDSLAAVTSSPDTVPAADSASDSLKAALFDLRTNPAQPLALGDKYQVSFAITYPAPPNPFAASVSLGNGAASQVALTGASGVAGVIVLRRGAPLLPDSVVVEASASRAVGTPVKGSPVRFVVRFQ